MVAVPAPTDKGSQLPGLLPIRADGDEEGQKGSSTAEVTAMVKAPKRLASSPNSVTPPLVPGGTARSVSEVIRRGRCFDRMPSSEAKVSAATAA
jgi:hypothetical protein